MSGGQHERREDPRTSRHGPVWWRATKDGEFRIGWLLEDSRTGAAFAMRDDDPPPADRWVEVSRTGPPVAGATCEVGAVRRVQTVHDDMYIVAVSFRPQLARTSDRLKTAESAAAAPADARIVVNSGDALLGTFPKRKLRAA